jgi:hypothetical protein
VYGGTCAMASVVVARVRVRVRVRWYLEGGHGGDSARRADALPRAV